MMDRTDRHFRYLLRQMTQKTLLYTEMVTAQAIVRTSNLDVLLGYSSEEHPIALQLGGDDPKLLAQCARIGEDMGYDEININCGCPSDRVQKGRFGVILMKYPELVAECVAAMKNAVKIPVTVKHRIGVDEQDAYEDMQHFVEVVLPSGANRFTVHARKAWLKGLSPKENRTVPPLRYDAVYQLKQAFPEIAIELNGGVMNLDEVEAHLKHVDAVMMGRAAYNDPFLFQRADARFFGDSGARTDNLAAVQAVRAMIPYAENMCANHGTRPHSILRHMLGLFSGQPGARAFRRVLSEEGPRAKSAGMVLEKALRQLPAAIASG